MERGIESKPSRKRSDSVSAVGSTGVQEAPSLPRRSRCRSADLLYNIISRRHEKRSTVITTNLAFKQWGTIFPGAACVVALVDRFVQHGHVLDIEGESWRQKEPVEKPAPRKPKH